LQPVKRFLKKVFLIKQKKDLATIEFFNYTLAMQDTITVLRGMPTNCPIRVDKKIAKQILLSNEGIICGGTVFFFGICDLGLGVCEIWKEDLHIRTTKTYPKNHIYNMK
jgi:hypothetical protein